MERSAPQRFQDHWHALADELKLPEDASREMLSYLTRHYGGGGRHYHGMRHIVAMLEGAEKLTFDNPQAAKLAIFFHDVIYDPSCGDNEELSAQALESMMEGYVDARTIKEAAFAVRATQPHVATDSRDTNLVIDLDMAILGQPWAVYERYARDTMKEYAPHYTAEQYRTGRPAFLQSQLDKGAQYITPEFKQLEEQAVRNMTREIELHAKGVGFGGRAAGA